MARTRLGHPGAIIADELRGEDVGAIKPCGIPCRSDAHEKRIRPISDNSGRPPNYARQRAVVNDPSEVL